MNTFKFLAAFFAFALLFSPCALRAQDSAPILALDPGGHTATVTQVLWLPDGKQVISVGDDKAIRVWDAATGRPLHTIRGQVGAGPDGKLYTAALSRDGQTLAVSVPTHPTVGDGFRFIIRLVDIQSGRIAGILPAGNSEGHSNIILSLAFSPDGKYLASGSADNTIRLWNVSTGDSQVLSGHTDQVYSVAWAPDSRQLASASLDHSVRIWNVATGKVARTLNGHKDGVRCVAWSSDGQTLASGSLDRTIRVWDAGSGKLRQTVPQEQPVSCLAWSADGKMLASGLDNGGNKSLVRLWSLSDGQIKQAREFNGHGATVQSMCWSPDGQRLASAGGYANDIYLWDSSTASVKQHIVGLGSAVQEVAWAPDSARIAWGVANGAGGFGTGAVPLAGTFDLAAVAPGPDPKPGEAWQRAALQMDGRDLAPGQDGQSVSIKQGGKEVGQIRLTAHGNQVRCFSWTPKGDIAVGSSFGLSLYDGKGALLHKFEGHTGDVLAVSASPDGRFLASASGDQTIKIWPLAAQGETVDPLLSIFVGSNREWVAWTNAGRYTCSADGENIMGWLINRGQDKNADYYSASRFNALFCRPDIMRHLMEAGSEDRAVYMAERESGRKTDLTKTAQNIDQFAPPSIQIISPADGTVLADGQITVKARIASNSRAVKEVRLSVNNRLYNPSETRDINTQSAVDYSEKIDLIPGTNTLSLLAVNDAKVESDPVVVKVIYRPAKNDPTTTIKQGRPTLHLLAIGVSDYEAVPKLGFAHKDAADIAALFEAQKGKLFDKVDVKLLTNKDATRDNVMDALDWLRKEKAADNDYNIVFVAGHGLKNDDGDYFFAPCNLETDRVNATGVKWTEFSDTLSRLNGKVLLLLDTCHSAGIDGKAETNDAYSRLLQAYTHQLNDNESAQITLASCRENEVSNEDPAWGSGGNGAFTDAMLEALSGKADYDHNGVVTISELDTYLVSRVPQLTDGAGRKQQHPSYGKPVSVDDDLPIAMVK